MRAATDALFRAGLRLAARLVVVACFFVRPRIRGAFVVVRDLDRVLLLELSYRPWRSLPGGRVHRGEEPIDGALRELREETGLRAEAHELALVTDFVLHHSYIEDHVWFFEWRPESAPTPEVDRREILSAAWVPEAELSQHPLSPPLAHLVSLGLGRGGRA